MGPLTTAPDAPEVPSLPSSQLSPGQRDPLLHLTLCPGARG